MGVDTHWNAIAFQIAKQRRLQTGQMIHRNGERMPGRVRYLIRMCFSVVTSQRTARINTPDIWSITSQLLPLVGAAQPVHQPPQIALLVNVHVVGRYASSPGDATRFSL